MSTTEILLSVLLGLLVNECCDLSPWLARKIVNWSVRHRYATDPVRAEIRSEELAALVDDRPGKLFKLATALGFAAGALANRITHTVTPRATALIRRTAIPLTGGSLGIALIAIWASLAANQVFLPEAYTLPFAVVAALFGAVIDRRTRWSSWRCYSAALIAGFLPTLALTWTSASMYRLTALCVAAAFTLIAGFRFRLQAPVVTGVLAFLAASVRMLADLLPTALFTATLLTLLGTALLLLGALGESRRRHQEARNRLFAYSDYRMDWGDPSDGDAVPPWSRVGADEFRDGARRSGV